MPASRLTLDLFSKILKIIIDALGAACFTEGMEEANTTKLASGTQEPINWELVACLRNMLWIIERQCSMEQDEAWSDPNWQIAMDGMRKAKAVLGMVSCRLEFATKAIAEAKGPDSFDAQQV